MAVNRLQISPALCSFGCFEEFKEHLALRKKSHIYKSAFIFKLKNNFKLFCTNDQVLLLKKINVASPMFLNTQFYHDLGDCKISLCI